MANEDRVHKLFAQFTWLRQTGSSRGDAWAGIQAEAMALGQVERNRLLSLLRGWEANEGHQYRKAQANDPFETHYTPPEGLKELRQTMNASKGIRRIKPLNPSLDPTTVTVTGAICPTCHTVNPPGQPHCANCGMPLGSNGTKPQKDDTQPLLQVGSEDAHFADDMALFLMISDADAVVRVRPSTNEMMIGRRSPDSVMIPDVDLSPYGADIKGVSRLHAVLRRHGQTLVITDMGSLNHTYVNEQRLHPHEVRVLHDGDQLRFGQLAVQVQFRREQP